MKQTIVVITILFSFLCVKAQEKVYIDVNANILHQVGDVTTFDRNKFVTIHADITENEWNGDNALSDLRDDFLNGYDVYLGRNTGLISWNVNNNIDEDPTRSGYAKPASVAYFGERNRNNFEENALYKSYEDRNDQILCAQLHPFYPDGQKTKKGWAFSQSDSESEPFGTATGEFMSLFLKEFYSDGTSAGQQKPQYLEVINEPLWHLVDYGDESPERVFRFHNAVADEVRKHNSEVKVGGFCTAFPDLEKNNFKRWEQRWKLFMDIAGEKMDYWTVHLYDFPSINNGKQKYRKGAQMEATFDMMEQYSYLLFGKVKPFMVSEFGAQMHDYNKMWSPYRDWLHMKSCNAMMMQFMERPNLINKTINFLPVKAEWGYDSANGVAYNHRLLRKENEPESYTGKWVYTDMVKLYELWEDVNGTRVDSKTSSVDVMCDSYIEDNKLYLIVNNLNLNDAVEIHPKIMSDGKNVVSLNVKHLYCDNTTPKLDEQEYSSIPDALVLDKEGTMVLEYTFDGSVSVDETMVEKKTYAEEYYKAIEANSPMVFHMNNIEVGTNGEAVLRLGIGRAHGTELFPVVKINDKTIDYEHNYRGDAQTQRESFFGVLEIPIEYSDLLESNTVSVSFSDAGGYVSSVALQNYVSSVPLDRFQELETSSKELKEGIVKVYPNPCSDMLRCELPNGEIVKSVELYDASGVICKLNTYSAQTQTYTVTTSDLAAGIYMVRVNTENNRYNSQIVIK